jgi:hypothetical protein
VTPLHTIDVAHPPRPPSTVEHQLTTAWHHVRQHQGLRVLKVIHGYGSTGASGSIRDVARNWAWNHRRHFRAVIDGEQYSTFDARTQELRAAVGQYADPDLGGANPGILIIWIH